MDLYTTLGIPVVVLVLFIIWSLAWKGWALWISAQKGSKPWFIALLILNTLGILEILYIFYFSKKKGLPKEETVVEVEINKK